MSERPREATRPTLLEFALTDAARAMFNRGMEPALSPHRCRGRQRGLCRHAEPPSAEVMRDGLAPALAAFGHQSYPRRDRVRGGQGMVGDIGR